MIDIKNLTETDKRAIMLIKGQGNILRTNPSGVGFLLYPEKNEPHNAGRSPQGMALCGGRAMRRLERMGIITIHLNIFNRLTEYKILNDPTNAKCPDGGTCHHCCYGDYCFRKECCSPLTDNGIIDDNWQPITR